MRYIPYKTYDAYGDQVERAYMFHDSPSEDSILRSYAIIELKQKGTVTIVNDPDTPFGTTR